MARQPVPHTDLRKAGLAAALIVGLLLTAGLAVVVFTRRRAPANPADKTPTPTQPEIAPDIADTGIQTGSARVQFADKKDPGRAAGMIEWAKLEPISQVEKRLTEPRGYVYMRDGGLVVITSKTGRLNTTPKVQEPQSGRFEGGVTLELFPAGTDPKSDKPTLVAKSDSLDFDMPSASISTTGPFTVTSTAVDIDGSGMRLIANQLEEGIERFEVAKVNKVTIRPDAKDPRSSSGLTTEQTARATPAGTPKGPDRLRTYRAVIEGGVKLIQGQRTLTAERAEAWAHLVNNRLPDGAIGLLGPEPATAGADKKPSEQPFPIPTPADGTDTTITGTWTGRMVVTPVTDTGEGAMPAEFKDNKAALRLNAGQTPVTVQDEAFKGSMTAARLDFGATSRTLTLHATPLMPVHIDTASAGSLVCKGATIDLGKGQIDLTGPGDLIPAPSAIAKASTTTPPAAAQSLPKTAAALAGEGNVPTNLTFAQQLTLNFRTAGNWITPDAESATIKGGFNATSGDVKASADEATVKFRQKVGDKNSIEELILKGNATASAPAATRTAPIAGVPAPSPTTPAPAAKTGARDTLSGQQMTFKFDADPVTGQETPKSVEVTGEARATAGGAGENGLNLKARSIKAELGKEKDQIVVVKAEANEDVHVSNNPVTADSSLLASGEKLTVDPAAGVAVLTGGTIPVTISVNGAVMMGPKVTLTQSTGEVSVDGPGSINSIKDENLAPGEEVTTSHAHWSKSMTFNNTTGKATCLGDASATMTVGDTQRDVAQAETIVLFFTPASEAPKPAAGKPAASAPRELISAEALGELGVDGKPPRPATLEHRQFAMVNGEQKLEQLVYLEGHKIVANQPARTLDVPVPGKLLVDDRTQEPAKTPAPTTPPAGGAAPSASPIGGFTSAKGTSLFTWMGSLHLDMTKGEATLKKDVALTHQPFTAPGAPAAAQTTLDCDQLTAFLKTQPPGAAPPAAPTAIGKLDASLEKVEAKGNVVAKSEGRQLTAETIIFDTVRQFIEAAGSNDENQTLVTYLDPARPAPLRARKISWDQKSGEVRAVELAPTTIGN